MSAQAKCEMLRLGSWKVKAIRLIPRLLPRLLLPGCLRTMSSGGMSCGTNLKISISGTRPPRGNSVILIRGRRCPRQSMQFDDSLLGCTVLGKRGMFERRKKLLKVEISRQLIYSRWFRMRSRKKLSLRRACLGGGLTERRTFLDLWLSFLLAVERRKVFGKVVALSGVPGGRLRRGRLPRELLRGALRRLSREALRRPLRLALNTAGGLLLAVPREAGGVGRLS